MEGTLAMTDEKQGEWTQQDQDKAAEKGQGAEIGGQQTGGKAKQTPDQSSQDSGGDAASTPSDTTTGGV
jgi:hypothetical protein